ncbi:MAG: hypothetical protein WEF86_06215 [Gemmatimonadota bacterium]
MSSFGGKVLAGSILAAIGLVTVKVLVALVSGIVALISFLIFTVLPIALVAYLIVKLFRYLTTDRPAYE